MNEKAPPEYIANRYRLQEQLGKGGMGSVYRAHDEMLDRDIAIKFLLPRQNPIGASSERFLREARAVARLSHPNIMLLFDMGQQDDWYYLVLEHIPGTNLHRMIEEQAGPLSLIEALRIIRETLKALGYAHAQGCIHRDIKPENIMVTLENEVKIADFGLALAKGDVRLTADDSVLGTALYMAPETTMGEDVDHRADLYAVGAVFYEMLTGQPPFDGDTAMQIMAHALHTPLTPPRMVNPSIPENTAPTA